jgi:hypothetical protein
MKQFSIRSENNDGFLRKLIANFEEIKNIWKKKLFWTLPMTNLIKLFRSASNEQEVLLKKNLILQKSSLIELKNKN